MSASPRPVVPVLGVPVARTSPAEALLRLQELHGTSAPASCYFVSAHSLNVAQSDAEYREALLDADLLLNDGLGMHLAALLAGQRFPHNLNGTDLLPRLLELAERRGWRLFLLGGRPGVAERARDRLSRSHPALRVVGTHDGYFDDDERVVSEVVAGHAVDLLLVAMGNPRQELFIHRHLRALDVRLAVGVGAFLDFAAGDARRAPAWLRRLRMEWLWRLGHEPGRLWRRYLLGNPQFLVRCLKDVLQRR